MSQIRNPFRINVGFLLSVPLGETAEFAFDHATVHIPPDLELLEIKGVARFSRTANGILLQAEMSAKLRTECVRCLINFQQLLSSNFTELYAFTVNSTTDSELLFPEDGYIDLSPLIREYFLLEKPISPLCKPECKGLCPICGENLNENTCSHEENYVDPRLEILKKLLE